MSAPSTGVFEYLEELKGTEFAKLYQHPSTALAIFRRMLPHFAKTLVMGMLYMPKPLPLSELALWMKPASSREKDKAFTILSRLHMVTSARSGKEQLLSLTPDFATSLRTALTGGDAQLSFGVPSVENVDAKVDIAFLDRYARDRWESILHYVVNSVGMGLSTTDGPSSAVQKLLQVGNLVEANHHAVSITQAGFSFLLQEVNSQVWNILILLVKNQQANEVLGLEILSFLFMLGSLELGRAYDTSTLSKQQQQMLSQLSDIGLIYMQSSNSSQFFPTRLATTLTSDASALRSIASGFDEATRNKSGAGFIIIETNYRLYAYTNSPLQIAVLGLFTKLNTRYPNMVAGRVSRDSVRRAISYGITADQIISYLSTHAHPQLRMSAQEKHLPILPPTVVDQIRLWQIENERMKATSGFLFQDFASQAEYEGPCNYAEAIGIRVWKSDAKRMFFTTQADPIVQYFKQNKPAKNS